MLVHCWECIYFVIEPQLVSLMIHAPYKVANSCDDTVATFFCAENFQKLLMRWQYFLERTP